MIEVMGILNTTPDSFSDGGHYQHKDQALKHAAQMIEAGAQWIDIGGESTRPGAPAVSLAEELERVIPVLEVLRAEFPVKLSVDTNKPEVMQASIAAGANMINDVKALQAEGALEAVAGAEDVLLCLMHMQGEPRTMQANPVYTEVVTDVAEFLTERVAACAQHGIRAERIILDPGFGFGKQVGHNYELLKQLPQIVELGFPVLAGLSRKSMLGAVTGREVDERLAASVAAATIAAMHGAKIIRVHDVKETVDAVKVVEATLQGEKG